MFANTWTLFLFTVPPNGQFCVQTKCLGVNNCQKHTNTNVLSAEVEIHDPPAGFPSDLEDFPQTRTSLSQTRKPQTLNHRTLHKIAASRGADAEVSRLNNGAKWNHPDSRN